MTPSNLISLIRERYNATGDSFFSDTMLYNVIYQAEMELALEAKVIENTYTTTSTASVKQYAYPSTAMSIRRVEYKGIKVRPGDLFDDTKTSVTEPTGNPGRYAIWDNEIVFFPTPDSTGNSIKVFSYDIPSEVSATSVLSTPPQYHLALIDLVMSVMFAKELNDKMASYHLGLWQRSVSRIKRERAKSKHGDQYAVVRDASIVSPYPGRMY